MVFSSLTFLYLFLPAVMLVYCIVPAKARNAVLLLASMTFYFCGEQLYLLLMLGEIVLAYAAGRLAEPRSGEKSGRGRKAVLVIFLVLSFGLLTLFKYADLLPETVNAIAGREVLGLLRLPLPIGISFYIFQGVSYGIDVYRGRYPAEKNPVRLALYISFFPQLIAGPIVRYDAIRESLAAERRISVERLERGIVRFCTGLGKKLLIADRLFANGIPDHYEVAFIPESKGDRSRPVYDEYGRIIGYEAPGFDPFARDTLHPDFYVLNKRTRKAYFWEHLGKLQDPKYCTDNLNRLVRIIDAGYRIGEEILITHEDSYNPLRLESIDGIISRYLK